LDRCRRLGWTCYAFLWQRNQRELLEEMIESGLVAILIKVAAMGLTTSHLGKSLEEMFPHLEKLSNDFGAHMAGEGGEYETLTIDCPLFAKKLVMYVFVDYTPETHRL
jgi:diphthine-ammonia ligase